MIASKSQSQATLPEESSRRLTSARLAIASFILAYPKSRIMSQNRTSRESARFHVS